MFTRFFRGKALLTQLCGRITLRMIHNLASENVANLQFYFAHWLDSSDRTSGDHVLSSLLLDVDHPKRSFIVYMLVSMAAAKFWNDAKEHKEFYLAAKSKNPFKSAHADVIISEALIFFWYSIFLFVSRAVNADELEEADLEATKNASGSIGHIIRETTGWPITSIFASRIDEYGKRASNETPTDVFSRILLRSIGKRTIDEPDHHLDPLNLDSTPVVMFTMTHVTAWLPGYCKIYENVVHHYPMD